MSEKDQIRDLLIRGILTASEDRYPIRFVQASIFDDELQDDIEHFEPYGFTSRAHEGAEVIVAHLDGDRSHPLALVITDRKYRIKDLKKGETCIFDSKGRRIYLRDGEIEIEAKDAPVRVHTSATVTIDAPLVKMTGNLQVDGNVTVGGNVTATKEVSGNGVVLSTHTHGGVERGSASTGAPNK